LRRIGCGNRRSIGLGCGGEGVREPVIRTVRTGGIRLCRAA